MVTGASWVHFKPRKTKIGQKKSLTPLFHRALQLSVVIPGPISVCIDSSPKWLEACKHSMATAIKGTWCYLPSIFISWLVYYPLYFTGKDITVTRNFQKFSSDDGNESVQYNPPLPPSLDSTYKDP